MTDEKSVIVLIEENAELKANLRKALEEVDRFRKRATKTRCLMNVSLAVIDMFKNRKRVGGPALYASEKKLLIKLKEAVEELEND